MLRSIAASMFSYLFETMESFISILRAWDGGPSNMAITRTSLFILNLQKFVIFEFFSLIFAQILMKFCRNFADNLENVEIF